MGILQSIIHRILSIFQGYNWLVIPAALLTVVFHEVSHGYIAYLLGDRTAKDSGRLSLNPLHHIDPVGLICMILFRFGWAKPVPVNPMYFKNRKGGMALTAVAGPVSNIVFALFSFFMIRLIILIPPTSELVYNILDFLIAFFSLLASLNVGLAVFNLIPIPPLDGSKILNALLPDRIYYKILRYEQYGFLVLIILLNFSPFDRLINIVANSLYKGMYALIF